MLAAAAKTGDSYFLNGMEVVNETTLDGLHAKRHRWSFDMFVVCCSADNRSAESIIDLMMFCFRTSCTTTRL